MSGTILAKQLKEWSEITARLRSTYKNLDKIPIVPNFVGTEGADSEKELNFKRRIYERYSSINQFRSDMGIVTGAFYQKIKGEIFWNQSEVEKACDLLGISLDNTDKYFYIRSDGKWQRKKTLKKK